VINPTIGAVSGSFNVSDTPAVTTVYTLTVTNQAGDTGTKTATVTVKQPAVTNFTGPAWITMGKAPVLTVTFTGASASVSNGCTPATASTSPATFTCPVITSDTTYAATAVLGNVTTQPTQLVVQVAPDPAVGLAFAASPGLVSAGASAALTATFCGGSTLCTATYTQDGTTQNAITSGVVANSAAINTSTAFTLTVTNAAGATASKQVTVLVFHVAATAGVANSVRFGATATTLSNGKVLIAGGSTTADGLNPVKSGALYDPATGKYTAIASTMGDNRYQHTATLLSDGRVLLAGGAKDNVPNPSATADIYDPAANTFSATGSMNTARSQHTATLIGINLVLIAGGNNGGALLTAELFAPGGTFSPLFNSGNCMSNAGKCMQFGRAQATATLLSGKAKVLIVGGAGASTTSDLFDVNTSTFSAGGAALQSRSGHTATLLNDGRVLLVGGSGTTTELFKIDGTASLAGPNSAMARTQHTANLMPGGVVLIAGGMSGGSATNSLEVFDPNNSDAVTSLTTTASQTLSSARAQHVSALLPSGNVLVSHGTAAAGVGDLVGE
jgi:hypothetical protein